MANFYHGVYGTVQTATNRLAQDAGSAIVYIGTAPVNQTAEPIVNKPVVIRSMSQAKKVLGYSDDWAQYTLCEAMDVHFVQNSIAPLIFINVFDPAKHIDNTAKTGSGAIYGAGAEIKAPATVVLSTVAVEGKTAGTDYEVTYDCTRGVLKFEAKDGKTLGDETLTATWKECKPGEITNADVIGDDDGAGLVTGVHVLENVYPVTGFIPAYVLAPGFDCIPEVHTELAKAAQKINGHWDAYLFVNLPITDGNNALTLATIPAWKKQKGYTKENESVYFPLAEGINGKIYHLSVLAAANFHKLLAENEGIPYCSASNTEVKFISGLYMGEDNTGRVYNDTLINNMLCKEGINSACYMGGVWTIWGTYSADWDSTKEQGAIGMFETNRIMLYYLSNDFQRRRTSFVDKVLTAGDIASIVSEEQTRLDALIKIGALCFGECHLNDENNTVDALRSGEYSFTFNVTVTPLAKALKARVNWTEAGFTSMYENL